MDQVEEIKQRLDVSDVLGSYIQLKSAGPNQRGLCPFHHEKTPSLMISNDKGIWHCFGCGEGGDIITFVEKMEGVDFRGALEILARRAGVTLEEKGVNKTNAKLKERLYAALEIATKYYQTGLVKSKTAQEYIIKERGFNKDAVTSFRLGFAPNTQTGLVDFLRKHKFNDQEIVKAGLARSYDGRLQDLFRNRFMMPFADTQGRIIGFTGRVLDDGMPKYLNTPQTLLFDKSHYVFGLFQAKEAIRQAQAAVLVEGNLDVVTAYQFGSKTVVATSGTALTQWQLKALARLAPNVKLAFDQDSAGLAATERSIPIAQNAGVALYIVNLPGAKDPDELIRKSPQAWESALKDAPYVMDWLLTTLIKQYDATSATGIKQISDRFIVTLARVPDPVEQDHYIQALAEVVKVDPAAIRQKLQNSEVIGKSGSSVAKAAVHTAQTRGENLVVEDALLSLCVTYPDSRVALDDLKAGNFSSPERQQLFEGLRNLTTEINSAKLPKGLQNSSNYVKILLLRGEEQYRDWAALDRRIEAFSLAQRLASLQLKKTKQNLQDQIAEAEAAGNESRRKQLLEQFRDVGT